jgi:hypothetical protein
VPPRGVVAGPARLRWVHLEMRARASPEGAPALRLGQAAAPSVVRGPGCRWRGLPRGRFSGRLSRFDWIVLPSARAVSSVAFVGPRSGDGAAAGQRARRRQRMRAALKLSFGPPRFGCGISDREVGPSGSPTAAATPRLSWSGSPRELVRRLACGRQLRPIRLHSRGRAMIKNEAPAPKGQILLLADGCGCYCGARVPVSRS